MHRLALLAALALALPCLAEDVRLRDATGLRYAALDANGNVMVNLSESGQQPMAGSIPVAIASDQSPVPVAAGASPSAAALSTKGLATLTAAVNVKASAGVLYGVAAVNGAASVCWVQCVDSAGAGTLGTNVLYQHPLPASGTLSVTSPIPLAAASNGIACGMAAAVNGAAACGTAGNVTVLYK
jgi:hypothetical protein